MSADITDVASPWQLVEDAWCRLGELLEDIPGWPEYTLAEETCEELRQAAALMEQALVPLERAWEREEARYPTRPEAERDPQEGRQ